MSEANNRKVESEKNNDLIRRQKQAEMMKNASIKEMIRKQKYDANDRKAMVSTRRGRRSSRTEKSREELSPQDIEFRQDQNLPGMPTENQDI